MITKQDIIKSVTSRESVIDVHTHVGIAPRFYYQCGYPYALSLEDLLIRMELLGIGHSVVFPFVDSAYYEKNTQSSRIKSTTRYCSFPYELENTNLLNEIYEVFPNNHAKALPFLMFDPSRKAVEQAKFMETLCDKYPVFGLKTASTYIQSFVNDLDAEGSAILEVAKNRQLPLLFHSSVHPEDPWASVYDIIRFAERHPDIRICIAHSARFEASVLERASRLENCYVDFSAFIIHCRLAVENSQHVASENKRFSADYSQPSAVIQRLANAFPDTMLWGSDTPAYYWIQKYYTSDGKLVSDSLKCGYRDEINLLNALPAVMRTGISHTNILRFLFGKEL